MQVSTPLNLVTSMSDMEPTKKIKKRLTLDEKADIIRSVASGQKRNVTGLQHIAFQPVLFLQY